MHEVNDMHMPTLKFEHDQKVLHLSINKVACGMTESALLWCGLHTSVFIGIGFELNPHRLLISNKTIDGKK